MAHGGGDVCRVACGESMSAHCLDLTGDYRTTIYGEARRLLAEGANPADSIETRRNGKLSMSGTVGQCAKWEVVDDGGLRLRKHSRPSTLARPAAKSLIPGTTLAAADFGAVAP